MSQGKWLKERALVRGSLTSITKLIDNWRGTIDEAFFNGKDVCAILGYKKANETVGDHLDEDEKSLLEVGPISGHSYNEGKAVYILE